jgi:galactokinase
MNPVIYKRCKYVVEENERLLNACEELNKNDLAAFGKLMYQTHDGLSNDYEVSCEELDYLVELTRDNPNVYGSRMMGGGFGGCTINLVTNEEIESLSMSIKEKYRLKFGIEPKIFRTKISNGTQRIRLDEKAEVLPE